jgi:hypothetical protein
MESVPHQSHRYRNKYEIARTIWPLGLRRIVNRCEAYDHHHWSSAMI